MPPRRTYHPSSSRLDLSQLDQHPALTSTQPPTALYKMTLAMPVVRTAYNMQDTDSICNALADIEPLLRTPGDPPYPRTQTDLESLRRQAAKLDMVTEFLNMKSILTKRVINDVASPINRLPNEVLSEIMVWACDIPRLTTYRPLRYQRFGKYLSPMVLGRVCHRWREVSRGTARLWTFLWVNLTFQTSWRDLTRIWHWFTMARNLTVTVNLTENDDTTFVEEANTEMVLPDWEPCQRALHLLFSYSDRIGSMFFQILDGGWRELYKTSRPFSRLQHLSVYGHPDPVTYHSTLYLFKNAPNLKYVDLWGVDPYKLDIPWNQVKGLRSCWAKVDGLFYALSQCPALESLHIRALDSTAMESDPDEGFSPSIYLPKLSSLSICDVSYETSSFLIFLRRVITPSLSSFRYLTFGRPSSSSYIIPDLLPFLERLDKNSLSDLDVTGILFANCLDLLKLLQVVPSVHNLRIDLAQVHGHQSAEEQRNVDDLLRLLYRWIPNNAKSFGEDCIDCRNYLHSSSIHEILPSLKTLHLSIDPSQIQYKTLFSMFLTRAVDCLGNAQCRCAAAKAGEARGYIPCFKCLTSPSGIPAEPSVLRSVTVDVHNSNMQVDALPPARYDFWMKFLAHRGMSVDFQLHAPSTDS